MNSESTWSTTEAARQNVGDVSGSSSESVGGASGVATHANVGRRKRKKSIHKKHGSWVSPEVSIDVLKMRTVETQFSSEKEEEVVRAERGGEAWERQQAPTSYPACHLRFAA